MRRIVSTQLQAAGASTRPDGFFDRIIKYIPSDIVAGWDAEKRRKLALLANVIPKSGKLPSADTWRCVEAYLRDRARRARQ